ncbi:unnamed protein product [Notodromas monacha]|uniref:Ig-like domain-containing protein n=1 Tax=Notodromas monacha TaxID=399045 RepID=A0A7R9GAC8_9CRUS|nr:unnamed protein product [Notodromas monacha]CAG0915219.1 unnamed protein product [Notodromas monacha]
MTTSTSITWSKEFPLHSCVVSSSPRRPTHFSDAFLRSADDTNDVQVCFLSTEKKEKDYTEATIKTGMAVAEILGETDRYVNHGSMINLTCVVRDSPIPPEFVYWYHDTEVISFDSKRGGVSMITDKGTTTSSFLLIQGCELMIVAVAEILGETDRYVNHGSMINLTCVVRDSPIPPEFVYWYHDSELRLQARRGQHDHRQGHDNEQFPPDPGNDARNVADSFFCKQVISFDSKRGGVSMITDKGTTTSSFLLIQGAHAGDAGKYTCSPSNSAPVSIRVHVLNGVYQVRAWQHHHAVYATMLPGPAAAAAIPAPPAAPAAGGNRAGNFRQRCQRVINQCPVHEARVLERAPGSDETERGWRERQAPTPELDHDLDPVFPRPDGRLHQQDSQMNGLLMRQPPPAERHPESENTKQQAPRTP